MPLLAMHLVWPDGSPLIQHENSKTLGISACEKGAVWHQAGGKLSEGQMASTSRV